MCVRACIVVYVVQRVCNVAYINLPKFPASHAVPHTHESSLFEHYILAFNQIAYKYVKIKSDETRVDHKQRLINCVSRTNLQLSDQFSAEDYISNTKTNRFRHVFANRLRTAIF